MIRCKEVQTSSAEVLAFLTSLSRESEGEAERDRRPEDFLDAMVGLLCNCCEMCTEEGFESNCCSSLSISLIYGKLFAEKQASRKDTKNLISKSDRQTQAEKSVLKRLIVGSINSIQTL
jgi:hypothetical protein